MDHFASHRNKVEDLYDSERYFLIDALRHCDSVLDVGCAAGGSFCFAGQVKPGIRYLGIDISSEMIRKARELYRDGSFDVYDGKNIPCRDIAFDLVFSLGVCHHIAAWHDFIGEMFRVAEKYAIFDVRLTEKEGVCDINASFQKIAFNEPWDDVTRVPYIVLNGNDFLNYLLKTYGNLSDISIYGYAGPPTSLAVTPFSSVYMTSVMLTKYGHSNKVVINHPFFQAAVRP